MIDFFDFIIGVLGITVQFIILLVTVVLAAITLPFWILPYLIYKGRRCK